MPSLQHLLSASLFAQHAFSWDAHNTRYAIPRGALETALDRNARCLLNVSRTVVGDVLAYGQERKVPVYALYITCGDLHLKERLLARGREDAAAIDGRLARSRALMPTGDHVLTIVNEGTVEEGVDAVRRALLGEEKAIADGRARTAAAAAGSTAAPEANNCSSM